MRKLLLGCAAVLLTTAAYATDINPNCQTNCNSTLQNHQEQNTTVVAPPATIPIPVPVPLPSLQLTAPALGWVYTGYMHCTAPDCSTMYVNVRANGVNVRRTPNGQPFLALVNGVPLIALQWSGRWALVGATCNLVPTGVWSDTAGVQLHACN